MAPRPRLPALFALAATLAAAALSSPATAAPSRAGVLGLTDVWCQEEGGITGKFGPVLECPVGHAIAVQAVFLGRDVPGVPSIPETCPCTLANGTLAPLCDGVGRLGLTISDNATDCLPAARDAAALAVFVAERCDGKQSCSVAVSSMDHYLFSIPLDLFPRPCVSFPVDLFHPQPMTFLLLRTTYDCYDTRVVTAIPSPVKPSRYNLGKLTWPEIRFPSTLAAPKVPALAKALDDMNKLALVYGAKAGSSAVELNFLDFDLNTVDRYISDATGGQINLGNLTSLTIRAINIFTGSRLDIARNTRSRTTLILDAVNVMVSHQMDDRLRVFSQGAPDVTVQAFNYYPVAPKIEWVPVVVQGARKTTAKAVKATTVKRRTTSRKRRTTTKRKATSARKRLTSAKRKETSAKSRTTTKKAVVSVAPPQAGTPIDAANPAYLSDPVAQLCDRALSEMVRSGRLVEAVAFAADLNLPISKGAPAGRPALSASLTRFMNVASGLLASGRNRALAKVPFLSRQAITGSILIELDNLANLARKSDSLLARGATVETAREAASTSLAVMRSQLESYKQEFGVQSGFLASMSETVTKLNSTYNDRLKAMDTAGAKYKTAVEAKVRKELAFAITGIVFDVLGILSSGGSAGFLAVDMYGQIKALRGHPDVSAWIILADLEKMSKMLDNVNKIFAVLGKIAPLVKSFMSLPKDPNYKPFDVTVDMAKSFSNGAINSSSLADLSVATLNFQDLHDQALLAFQPSVVSGIGAATDFSIAIAQVANAGFDLTTIMINELAQLNQVVLSSIRYQAALAQLNDLQASVDTFARQATAVTGAVRNLQQAVLESKLRALDRLDQACAAYEFANTEPCPGRGSVQLDSSPEEFSAQLRAVLDGLSTAASASQCICNMSIVVTDPGFIGNLSAGQAVLDLVAADTEQRLSFFDNLHIFQMNIKPIGIQPSTPTSGTPWLRFLLATSGRFLNTGFVSSMGRYLQEFIAPAVPIQMIYEPANGFRAIVPGALTDEDTSVFYVPTPQTRFTVTDRSQGVVWDYSNVKSVLVELYGYGRLPPGQLAADQAVVPNTGSIVQGGSICSVCFNK